jgi:hypothetical protein
LTSEVLHWVSVKFVFKFSASEFEAATRAGANLVAQRQAAEAEAIARSRLRGDPQLVLSWPWPLGKRRRPERPALTLEQVEEKLLLCIAQSNAAIYEKRRRRAERRAR